jgi:MFS family permease
VAATVSTARAASAQANAASYGDKQKKIAVLVVALAFAMDLADSAILNIALPTIRHHMHASDLAIHWIAGGYTLTFALLLIAGGRLGDAFGYKKLFLAGVAAFMLSSLLVGTAWSPDALIVTRFIQGAAAAMMVPQVMSVVQVLYKADERVQVNGMLGGISLLATTLAPIATGLLIKANIGGLSWRPIFLINVPVCLAALVLAAKFLPNGKSEQHVTVDIIGTVLVIVGMGLIVYPSIQGQSLGSSAATAVMLVAAVPVFGLFTWWQLRRARTGSSPLVLPSLFRDRAFSVGLLISLLFYATILCFGLTFSLLLQLGHGFSAIHTVLTSFFLLLGVLPTVGLLTKKVIPALGRWSLTLGAVLAAVGIGAVAIVTNHAGAGLSTWDVAPGLVVMGIGMGLVSGPLLPYVLSGVHTRDAGTASGTANAVQQVGGALGYAVIGAVFFSELITSASYNRAFSDSVWLQVGLLAACAVLALFLPRRIAAEAYTQNMM